MFFGQQEIGSSPLCIYVRYVATGDATPREGRATPCALHDEGAGAPGPAAVDALPEAGGAIPVVPGSQGLFTVILIGVTIVHKRQHTRRGRILIAALRRVLLSNRALRDAVETARRLWIALHLLDLTAMVIRLTLGVLLRDIRLRRIRRAHL